VLLEDKLRNKHLANVAFCKFNLKLMCDERPSAKGKDSVMWDKAAAWPELPAGGSDGFHYSLFSTVFKLKAV